MGRCLRSKGQGWFIGWSLGELANDHADRDRAAARQSADAVVS
jgi:hypothetical protein